MRQIGYNSQRDNFAFAGKFSGYKQCFSTSAFMFMSFYSDKINVKDDKQLAWYVDQVEAGVGEKGIAERVKAKLPWIPAMGSSYWWNVQCQAITEVLNIHKVKSNAIFTDAGNWSELENRLILGPCIVATTKMGGLPGGHIVLFVDMDEDNYILNDPFGNPLTEYKDSNGEGIKIPKKWIKPFCENATKPGKVRFINWCT